MDYGKMAYLKAEELEERLNRQTADASAAGGAYAAFYERHAFLQGAAYALTTVRGNGAVTLVIKLHLTRHTDIKEGTLTLTAGGMAVSRQSAAGKAGGMDCVLLASVHLTGDSELQLVPDMPLACTLSTVEVAAMGAGVTLARRGSDWSADYCEGGNAGVAVLTGNEVYTACVQGGVLGPLVSAGRGRVADLTNVGDNFFLVYGDELGNLWGVRYDSDMHETLRRHLGTPADDVAVSAYGERLAIALLRGRTLYIRTCETDFSALTQETELDIGTQADAVAFVRHTNPPLLAVSREGSVYLKLPAFELRGDKCLYSFDTVFALEEV